MVLKGYRGDVGIGTLIVFIAMVLLNVSGMLQQRASATGKETTKQVSSNIMVQNIVGNTSVNGRIENLSITIKAAAGSGRIDIKNMLIEINNGTNEVKLVVRQGSCGSTPTSTAFTVTERVDPNNVLDTSTCTLVIDSSTLADINVDLSNSLLLTRGTLSLRLIPEVGAPISLELKGPEVINAGGVYRLYP